MPLIERYVASVVLLVRIYHERATRTRPKFQIAAASDLLRYSPAIDLRTDDVRRPWNRHRLHPRCRTPSTVVSNAVIPDGYRKLDHRELRRSLRTAYHLLEIDEEMRERERGEPVARSPVKERRSASVDARGAGGYIRLHEDIKRGCCAPGCAVFTRHLSDVFEGSGAHRPAFQSRASAH